MLLRHALIYGIGRGIPGIINFLAIAAYTRLLQPEDYGYYALTIAAVGLWSRVLFEWIRLGLVRFFPAQSERPQALLATVLSSFLIMAAIAALGAGVAALVIPDRSWVPILAFGFFLLCADSWFELNLELSRIQLSPVRYCLAAACRALVSLAVGIALVRAGWGATGALIGVFVGLVVSVLPLSIQGWREAKPAAVERGVVRELLVYGLPLTASIALNFVVSTSDRFMIGWLLGSDATGVYAAGYDLVWNTLTMLMFTINLAGYPLAIRTLEREGVASCHRQIRQNLLLLLAIALPAAAGIAVCATSIASVILGSAFRDAAVGLLPWVALGVVIARLKTYYVDLSFHLGRRTVSQIWVMLVAAAVNVGLNLWLIPTFGVRGAIYATIAAYGIALVYGLWVGRRIFPLPAPPLEALKPVAATLLTVACLWPFRSAVGLQALLAQVAAGAGIYGLSLLALDFAGVRRLVLRRLTKSLGQPAKPAAKVP